VTDKDHLVPNDPSETTRHTSTHEESMAGVPVTIVGEAFITGLGVGGGPMPGGPGVMPPIHYPPEQPPVPAHPIVIPPDSIGPGVPSHPIYIPVYPAHPIVIPPDAIGPGVPSHPIYLPQPPIPSHPIVIPPGAIGPDVPSQPIFLPPYPSHPIELPPDTIGDPAKGAWVYSNTHGWLFVIDPAGSGGKPVPGSGGQAQSAEQRRK
jgi:hypothetical protein